VSPPIARRSAWARRGQLALIGAAVALSVTLSVASFEFAALMGRALGTGASSVTNAPPDLLIERVVPWWALAAAVVGSTALGAVAAVVPGRRAAALPPIEAARQ
jgi:putative ABC transport system permease protein